MKERAHTVRKIEYHIYDILLILNSYFPESIPVMLERFTMCSLQMKEFTAYTI